MEEGLLDTAVLVFCLNREDPQFGQNFTESFTVSPQFSQIFPGIIILQILIDNTLLTNIFKYFQKNPMKK